MWTRCSSAVAWGLKVGGPVIKLMAGTKSDWVRLVGIKTSYRSKVAYVFGRLRFKIALFVHIIYAKKGCCI